MKAQVLDPLPPRARETIVVAALAVWTLCVTLGVTGLVPALSLVALALLVLGPGALGAAYVIAGSRVPAQAAPALAWMLVVGLVVLLARAAETLPVIAVVPALIAVIAVATRRRPELIVVTILLMAGMGPTLELYTRLPVGPLADLLLVSLWVGYLWSSAFQPLRHVPTPVHVGLYVLLVYIGISAIYALSGENTTQGLFGFRAMCWFMLGALAMHLSITTERRQRIVTYGFIVAGALVGGYAMLRWAIGPSAKEELAIRAGGPYVLKGTTDEPLLSGSLLNPDSLGLWCGWMVGYATTIALSPSTGRAWRVTAAAVAACSAAALAGTDTRVSTLGAAAAALAALALFGLSRGFSFRRVVPLAIGLTIALGGGGAFAVVQLADSTSRFEGLLNPTNDFSYQERVTKWKTILSDLDENPLGHGIGTAGIGDLTYARFYTNARFDPDSSYVKIAYEQGYVLMGLFIVALLVVLCALCIRALAARNEWDATRAIAGFSALTALLVMMSAGIYNEGLVPFAVWIAAAIGLAPRRAVGAPLIPAPPVRTQEPPAPVRREERPLVAAGR